MKIGIFDSGLGGLIIARAIRKKMPEYDYVYLGDTKRVPYGSRPQKEVLKFTTQAVDYLFRKKNCAIVIIACNTASARALRKIQQKYLTRKFKERKVLGVLIPAAEVASVYKRVGVLATEGTVASNTFPVEIKKLHSETKVFQNPAPMLVPLIEAGNIAISKNFLLKYLKPFKNKDLDALVLGCTHYPLLKKEIKKMMPKKVKIISQDEIVPKKLQDYFARHAEITKKISHNKSMEILVTKKTQSMNHLIKKWFGKNRTVKVLGSSLFS